MKIDGVEVSKGDRILITGQRRRRWLWWRLRPRPARENGIYEVTSTSSWRRPVVERPAHEVRLDASSFEPVSMPVQLERAEFERRLHLITPDDSQIVRLKHERAEMASDHDLGAPLVPRPRRRPGRLRTALHYLRLLRSRRPSPSIKDVPCGSCVRNYWRPHYCDVPEHCPCDSQHVRLTS